MSTIWKNHDLADKRPLQRSQPLQINWMRVCGLTILILSALAAWRVYV